MITTTVKKLAASGAFAIVAATQTGCATQVKSLPLSSAASQSHDGVQVYFGQQNHPAVGRQLGDVNYSVRVARNVATAEQVCSDALAEGMHKLREAARAQHANAVIDVSTRFHSTESTSPDAFTCGVSSSAAAVAVRGRLVVLEAN
ncbi:hypothetical protein SAMN05443245_2697 [Paraburkholderia fungorum]|uniref:Signal peptidase n=1 Tax=Paraburkholderia fungorum TaxID=134537 RepID=A0A1H1DL26_9BURK|nr:signal peptidase [Paraburkholderia fungorum]SDQ77157.1 hypothetical protein SAMN05443245_2697 [Paraburkholderia fungorum]